jgi:hypothetical protein
MKGKLIFSIVASVVIGYALEYVRLYYLARFAVVNPIPHWLATHGVNRVLWYGLLYIQDVTLAVAFFLPLMFILRRLRPYKPWTYFAIAVLTGFVSENRGMFDQQADYIPFGMYISIYGISITPVAFLVAGAVAEAVWRAGTCRNKAKVA